MELAPQSPEKGRLGFLKTPREPTAAPTGDHSKDKTRATISNNRAPFDPASKNAMTPRPFTIKLELQRFESHLREQVDTHLGSTTPSRLAAAIRYAVFSGAGRLRPTLGLAMSHALGVGRHPAVLTLCSAVELVHTASLIHDDLPCFDDADLRRGQASVHAKFGEALAVLAGDALITLGFAVLAAPNGLQTTALIGPFAQAIGPARGLIGGQAQESERTPINPDHYHDAKTGSLFALMARGLAMIGRENPEPWARWGGQIGRIYQRCDDLCDAAPSEKTGKPQGQDQRHARPQWKEIGEGLPKIREELEQWLASTPPCSTKAPLSTWAAALESRIIQRLS